MQYKTREQESTDEKTTDDADECEECAGLTELPCFECYMDERGHAVGGGA